MFINTALQIVEIRHQEQNDNLWIDQITRLTSLLEDKITNKVYEIGIVKKSISYVTDRKKSLGIKFA